MSPWTVSSGHKDGSINVWDLRAQRLSWSLQAHSSECRSVEYSPNGRWLLSSSFDNSISITDCDIWERRIVSQYNDHKNKVLGRPGTHHAQCLRVVAPIKQLDYGVHGLTLKKVKVKRDSVKYSLLPTAIVASKVLHFLYMSNRKQQK